MMHGAIIGALLRHSMQMQFGASACNIDVGIRDGSPMNPPISFPQDRRHRRHWHRQGHHVSYATPSHICYTVNVPLMDNESYQILFEPVMARVCAREGVWMDGG